MDNLIAFLEHRDRVESMSLSLYYHFKSSDLEKVLAVTQVPFAELKYIILRSSDKMGPVLPDSFSEISLVQ